MDRNKSILIIDDDPDVTESLVFLLNAEGYSCATSSNGLAAIEYLEKNPLPKLILLDLMMPIMDGYQFHMVQQQDVELAQIPTILLTAGTIDRRIEDMKIANFFPKPVPVEELMLAINQYC